MRRAGGENSGGIIMKASHMVVAIVFFLLGAACAYFLKPQCSTLLLRSANQPASETSVVVQQKGDKLAVTVNAPEEPLAKPVAAPQGPAFRIEKGVNRQASDYRDFALVRGDDYTLCQKACEAETKCAAFTYVKAGPRGAVPHCWLKNTVPEAYADDQCITGVRQ